MHSLEVHVFVFLQLVSLVAVPGQKACTLSSY